MNGTVTQLSRRKTGVVRRASFWEDRRRKASTWAEKGAVSFDWFRARVKRLSEAEQETVWRQYVAFVDGLAPDTGRPRIRRKAS